MKKMFLSALAVAALAFVGCTEDATNDLAQNGGAAVELHEITFEAEIEQPSRTSLVDPGTGTSYVCWDADDVIGIVGDDNEIYQATIKTGAGSAWATYSASLPEGVEPLAAFYPYQFARETKSGVTLSNGSFSLNLPAFQTYKAGSVFGDDENLMVGMFANGNNGPKCSFKSVMGAFEFKFTGSQKVEAITVKASSGSQKMSGPATVNPSAKVLTMGTTNASFSFVSLEVPEAVTLNSSKATSFYVLVPAGTYEALQIGVMTEDGSYVRTATKAHTVKAGEIKPINCGNLDTMIDESKATNISADGYANCYVVVPNGAEQTYSFETKYVDGTAITTCDYHTNNNSFKNLGEVLEPHMAQILWAEDTNVAYDIQFDKANGKVYFKNNGKALGNARIILCCDQIGLNRTTPAGPIIWGWHIWSTPSTPAVGIVVDPNSVKNNDTAAQAAARTKINLMDRNLGATWTATTVSEVNNMTVQNAADALGLFYQAGNVSPYPRPAEFGDTRDKWVWARAKYQYGFQQYTQYWTNSASIKTSVGDNLQMPFYKYSDSYTPSDNNYTGSTARNSWLKKDFRLGGTKGSGDANVPILWSNDFKTNYDPCPPGWRVPHQGNLYQWVTGASRTIANVGTGAVNKLFAKDATYGQYITYNGVDVFFTPATGYLSQGNMGSLQHGYFWGSPYGTTTYTSTTTDGETTIKTVYNSGSKAITNDTPQNNGSDNIWPQAASGFQMRCVKKN
ncbi:MAG: hypothetical protein J6Q20_01335 [Alistipes sp.]|nr:hypothetical protein [Alistipes sp.]